MLRAVADSPARMQLLASARVRDALLASRDQLAAVAMMLRADGPFDPFVLRDDVLLAYDGSVSPLLLWDKHPIAVSATAVLALLHTDVPAAHAVRPSPPLTRGLSETDGTRGKRDRCGW